MELLAILDAHGPQGDPGAALVVADYFLDRGEERLAAAALDRAWGLAPDDPFVTRQRQGLLDRLAVTEHGICFRYVPAGTFLMGSDQGDPDERPVHPVKLGHYWLSETPITWATYCDLMKWLPPPAGRPGPADEEQGTFSLRQENKIRLQYCETFTRGARDWHAHSPKDTWTRGDGTTATSAEIFGPVNRSDPSRPFEYDIKPMIAVSWQSAEDLARRISTTSVRYGLPGEAQWEKAARGGRVSAPYPWGHEPPDPGRCDFGRFGEFSLHPPRLFPENGYGLLGMSGGVWEWTADVYDALAYHPARPPAPRQAGQEYERVLRGGSWADCADAVTVSFRMSRAASSWRDDHGLAAHAAPNIGFRLCRMEVSAAW
jgi:formylglycine-generating enzyme